MIHDHKNPVEGRRMGPPIEGAKEAIEHLLARGNTVYVFTARAATAQHVVEWLAYWGFPALHVTNVKQPFDLLIDDHAVAFTSWAALTHPALAQET